MSVNPPLTVAVYSLQLWTPQRRGLAGVHRNMSRWAHLNSPGWATKLSHAGTGAGDAHRVKEFDDGDDSDRVCQPFARCRMAPCEL